MWKTVNYILSETKRKDVYNALENFHNTVNESYAGIDYVKIRDDETYGFSINGFEHYFGCEHWMGIFFGSLEDNCYDRGTVHVSEIFHGNGDLTSEKCLKIEEAFQEYVRVKNSEDKENMNKQMTVQELEEVKIEELNETVTIKGIEYSVERDGDMLILTPVPKKPEGRATLGEYRQFLKPGEQYLMLVSVGKDMELRGDSGGRIRSDKNLIQPI